MDSSRENLINARDIKMSRSETSGMRQFLMLLYKGLLLRRRHYIVTIFEIVVPVLIASIPAIIQSEIGGGLIEPDKAGWVNATTYDPFDPLIVPVGRDYGGVIFLYAPAGKETDRFMEKAVKFWKVKHRYKGQLEMHSYTNEEDLENGSLMKRQSNKSSNVIGTVFNSLDSRKNELNYKIRYGGPYGSNSFLNELKYRVNGPQQTNAYTKTYFLSWQAAVERTFIEERNQKKVSYQLSMQRFPYPGHKENKGSFSFISIVPWVIGYGFLIFITNLVRRVIEEKSSGSKELLKMMGMTDLLYWTSTFINYFAVAALAVFIISIIYKSPLKYYLVFVRFTDFFLLLFLLLLFMAQLVLFCLAFTTFFTRAALAIVVVLIVYNTTLSLLSSNFFLLNTELNYFPLPLIAKLSICLLPPGTLLTICFLISEFEASGEGVRWSNLTEYGTNPDLNMLMVIGVIILSYFMYSLIIWYVDAVWPWQYGVPKPFYFPFTKNYWLNIPPKELDESELSASEDGKSAEYFEDDPSGITPGVVIHRLSKMFRSGLQRKLVVNNVSLKIYNGQITALLGHNGAGKTTTINILTGLYTPSSGTASINGYDVLSQTTKARKSLGVCPQHNVLYDTLTVEEHLKIYAGIKGVPWNKLASEAFDILKILNLTNKKTELAKNLSGGMKRKLCLGLAIIGGSKVLFLDEPTSGMDAEARRSVWDALLDLRHDRTIILTTHYMEEADILGDRIAIMAEGEIQCCGSPMFLKRKFGTGYHLHVVKDNNFQLEALTELLKKYIPDANLENESEKQATFVLSNVGTSFGEMFENLEQKKTLLGISSCGVTVTTMEDVFLNVANISDLKLKNKEEKHNGIELDIEEVEAEAEKTPKYFDPLRQKLYKMFGLLVKRLHYTKRHWGILINQLIIPFLIILFCMHLITSTSDKFSSVYPPLKLDISDVYGNTDGFLQAIDEADIKPFSEKLQKELKKNNIDFKMTDDPEKMVLNYASSDFSGYLKRLLVGARVSTGNDSMDLVAWYNGEPYHVTPMSLLLMDTAILNYVTDSDSGSITLTNEPLPFASPSYSNNFSRLKERLFANIFITMALSFATASFVMVPIHERVSKAKLLQLMTGISASLYWSAMFIWDLFVHTIVCILLIIPFSIFSNYVFFAPHSEAIGTVILMMILYGWANIPISYLVSFVFKKPNTGFSVAVVINVFTGVIATSILSTIIATIGGNFSISNDINVSIWILRIFPSFAVSFGFANLFAIAYDNAFCDQISKKDYEYYCNMDDQKYNPIFKCCKDICGSACLNQTYPITWDEYACGRDIFFLALDGCLYFAIVLFLETGMFKSLIKAAQRLKAQLRKSVAGEIIRDTSPVDSDVFEEETRIENMMHSNSSDEALLVKRLTKSYRNFYAVDHLTFGIHKEECFGLLGVNGAGKTTTFRMLTGDCSPMEGDATLFQQHSLVSDLKKFQTFIGYCPQFDALIDRLTGREMITLFGRLRGLSGRSLTQNVNNLIATTDLDKHADKETRLYSGGTKRKLSIALSLVGSPPLVLLDEPTAGVDPVSRRKIWTILSKMRRRTGAAIILTTHSMEETEALCNRLAIMVNGRFRCLGPIQQLKTKFGQGYTIIIKLKRETQSNPQYVIGLKSFIDANLPGAHLRDDNQGMLQYHVVDPRVTLSHLFKFMDEIKPKFDLEDYLISDTSLEQIFLTFARAQRIVG